MPDAQVSMMSLSASGFYLVVMLACLTATAVAIRQRQQGWHARLWMLFAVLFAGLALMRVLGLEEVFRDSLRTILRDEATYDARRDVQRPLAAAVIAGTFAVAGFLFWRFSRTVKGRRNVAVLVAAAATGGMVCLLALRLISLHQIDVLLYGPLKLNWFLDLGAALAVLGSAGFYVRTVLGNSGRRAR